MFCFLEFRKWNRLQFWNTSNRRNWKSSYTEPPFFLRMLDSFRSLHIPSSLMASPNLHWISGLLFPSVWFIIRLAPFLGIFWISLILLYQRTGAFCCQCTNIFASKARNLKVFSWFGVWEVWVISNKIGISKWKYFFYHNLESHMGIWQWTFMVFRSAVSYFYYYVFCLWIFVS